MYLSSKLLQVGITATTPKTAIAQAMQIGSAKAIETAIGISCTGISWSIELEYENKMTREELNKFKRDAVKAFIEIKEVKAALFKLKQIMHEGC
jgi:hypothetical protein